MLQTLLQTLGNPRRSTSRGDRPVCRSMSPILTAASEASIIILRVFAQT